MELAIQLMMALSLAACAGLRAWLPLFAVGIAGHFHFVPLNPSFAFLADEGVLAVFAVATILEVIGDKVLAIDHFLDAVGTLVRPAAGAVIGASMLTHTDPGTATILGLIGGGAASLSVHAGKAVTRGKMTATAPLHLGVGNAVVSAIEDVVAVVGVVLALLAPVLAFMGFVAALTAMALLTVAAFRSRHRLAAWLGRARAWAARSPAKEPV